MALFETIKNIRYLDKSETFCQQTYSCHALLLSYPSFPHLWRPCLGFNLSLPQLFIIQKKQSEYIFLRTKISL